MDIEPLNLGDLDQFAATNQYNYSVSKNDEQFTVRLYAKGGQLDPIVNYGESLQDVILASLAAAREQIKANAAKRPQLHIFFQKRVEGVWSDVGHYREISEVLTDKDITNLGAVSGASPLIENGVPPDFDVVKFPDDIRRVNWQFIASLAEPSDNGMAFDPDFFEYLREMYSAGARRIVYGFTYPQQ